MSDGVVDLSDSPQHSEFGEATGAPGDTSGDRKKSIDSMIENLPVHSSIHKISKNFTESLDRHEQIFDGEGTLDDLLAQLQAIVTIQGEITAIVEVIWANKTGPDPGFLVSSMYAMGLDFMMSYFQPLQDLVGLFTGNKERIQVSGMMWSEAGKSLIQVADEVGKIALTDIDPNWKGEACGAAGQRLSEFQGVLEVAAQLSGGIAVLMELTADFADRLYNQARQLLIDVVDFCVSVLWAFFSPEPATKADVIVSAVLLISRTAAQLLQMAIQAARVYLQGGLLMWELSDIFEKTMKLLDTMANPSKNR